MTAILLAGGRSARFGADKAAIELNGETLVERHLRQLRQAGVRTVLIVCNSGNQETIQSRTGAPTVLQRGSTMSTAVLTGIEAAGDGDVLLVCVNDIIGDRDYQRIVTAAGPEDAIVIPTVRLDRRFPGGCLDLDSATGAVHRIVEKPPGGCPPGSWANIMIHQIGAAEVTARVASLVRDGLEYEAALNDLIRAGVRVRTVRIGRWAAIKTPDDLARARAAGTQ